jgi:hypothetical protein
VFIKTPIVAEKRQLCLVTSLVMMHAGMNFAPTAMMMTARAMPLRARWNELVDSGGVKGERKIENQGERISKRTEKREHERERKRERTEEN